ncbi:hypothetical protein [Aquimarina sp. Aq78]|uniref:hypothetical protein n=1 Tax=Aquimarina sp. Aq78 TaxID=1191889 RepID=UPI000D0F75E4|nr:hypothetical protein [Aquimarina sp. Aq78]
MRKVALIGNMNNNFSAFCRYLRDEGIDAHLFLLQSDYFHPSDDSFADDWKSYTFQLDWGGLDTFDSKSFKEVKKKFSQYDLTIGCGTTPAFFHKAGLTLDVYIPYGADLYDLPFFKIVKPSLLWAKWSSAKSQKKGIREAKHIFMAPTGGLLEDFLKKVAPDANVFNEGVPMLYYKELYSDSFYKEREKSEIIKTIQKIKLHKNQIIFHSSRHYWKTTTSELSIKANDYLFRGLKEFINETGNKSNFHIITFEYGVDVQHSKDLIKELEIEDHVTWIPKSLRKDVMMALSMSDIVVGELYHSYFSYGIIYEALALKKLIIHKRIDDQYKEYYDELYPMCYADSPQTIKGILCSCANNEIDVDKVTQHGFDWFDVYLIKRPINKILDILKWDC